MEKAVEDSAPYTDIQSQRDCVLQPRVARRELPWVRTRKTSPTPTGLCRFSSVALVTIVVPAQPMAVESCPAKELQYHFVPATRMWGPDKAPLTDPTRVQMLREGTPVWYRLGQGVDNQTITELRLFNPETPPLGGGKER